MSDYKFISYETEENIVVITINNPPANSLNTKVMKEIDIAITAFDSDEKLKAAIITGAGSSVFVAGADIREIATINSKEIGKTLSESGQKILSKIEGLKKPVIAAINGLCLGGGNELALACHIRVASDNTKLGQPEINLGIIPGFGGTQRLPRLIGKGRALEMILTGDTITSKEAYNIGMVDILAPSNEVLKHAKGLAKRIALKGLKAIELSLSAVNDGLNTDIEKGMNLEAERFGAACETADMKEGITAFIEKRQPVFKDK